MNPHAARLVTSLLLLAAGPSFAGTCEPESVFRAGFDDSSALYLFGVVVADGAPGSVSLHGLPSGPVEVEIDASGTFAFALPDEPTHAMLSLAFQGASPRPDIAHRALLGSVFALEQLASTGTLTPGGLPALALDGQSTAGAILAETTNGAPIGTDCELQQALAQIDPAALIERAAIVKLILEDDSVSLPAAPLGTPPATTAELLADPDAYAAFVANLESIQPGLLEATEELFGGSFCSLTDSGRIWLEGYNRPFALLDTYGGELMFSGAGEGDGIWFEGSDSFTSACFMGDIEFTFTFEGRVTESFLQRDVGGVPQQVRALSTVLGERWSRLDPGSVRVDIAITQSVRIDFPDTPALPSEFETRSRNATVVRATGGLPLSAANLEGRNWLLLAGTTSDSIGLPTSNIMTLAAGGSGSERDGGALSWSTDGDTLSVSLADGRVVRHTRLRDEGVAIDTLSTFTPPGGTTRAFMKLLIADDPTFSFTAPAIPQRYRQRGDSGPLEYGFNLYAGGLGENFGPGGFLAPVGWVLDGGNVVIRRCFSAVGSGWVALDREPLDDECLAYQRRSWEPMDSEGGRLYVLEHLRIWNDDPFDTPVSYDQPRPMFYVVEPLPVP